MQELRRQQSVKAYEIMIILYVTIMAAYSMKKRKMILLFDKTTRNVCSSKLHINSEILTFWLFCLYLMVGEETWTGNVWRERKGM